MNKSFKLVKQQGASLVLTVMMLTGILGFFALAIDVGYLFVVRNQLQNAADSAALSGANYLYPLESTSPNWSLASSKATTTVQQNKVDNIALAVGTINTGYWNITGSPTGLHASKSDAISSSNYDYPAVQVTITKTATNAVVNTFFAGVLGIKFFSPSATAVAVGGLSPGYTKENILPFVIPGCVVGVVANDSGTLKYYNNSGALTYPDGQFQTESSYGASKPTCYTGQWTSLLINDPSGSAIIKTINALSSGGNSDDVFKIGDQLFLQSGTTAALYDLIGQCSVKGSVNKMDTAGNATSYIAPTNASCHYVIGAITCPSSGLCDGVLTDSFTQVVGFVCVMVVNANSADSSKYITYQVVPQSDPNYKLRCNMHDSVGIGPSGGAIMPPKLVNYWGNVY